MKKISYESFLLFNQQLASMVKLDLPLNECLRRIALDMKDKKLSVLLENLSRDVEKGLSYSDALKKYSDSLPGLYIDMIKAGEESGNLSEVLFRLVEYGNDMLELKNEVKSRMIYPAFLIAGLIGMLLIFSLYVLPNLYLVYEQTGTNIRVSSLVELVVNTSRVLHENRVLILPILCLVVFIAYLFFRFVVSKWWVKGQFKVPFWKDFIMSAYLSRFCTTFGHLLKSGVSVTEGFSLTGRVMGNSYMEARLAEAGELVSKGEKISSALEKAGVFPGAFTWLLKSAEEKEDLVECLLESGDFYRKRAKRLGDGIVAVMEPAVIIIFGIIVGQLVVLFFLPMFEMGEMAGEMN